MIFRVRERYGKLSVFIFAVVFFLCVFTVNAALAQKLAVKASVANIRSGPGTNYEVLWQVEKYTPLLILDKDKSGKWYYIKDFEGTIGWITKDLLTKLDTVITKPKEGQCNIRSGPGTNNDVILKAVKGVPFKVIQRKGNWIKIQHVDGDTGWVHKVLVW
jgi:SH3-like domain-containing protein